MVVSPKRLLAVLGIPQQEAAEELLLLAAALLAVRALEEPESDQGLLRVPVPGLCQ